MRDPYSSYKNHRRRIHDKKHIRSLYNELNATNRWYSRIWVEERNGGLVLLRPKNSHLKGFYKRLTSRKIRNDNHCTNEMLLNGSKKANYKRLVDLAWNID